MSNPSPSQLPADTSTPLREGTVGDLLRHAAAERPDATALITAPPPPAAEERWTFAELLAEAERIAHWLLQHAEPGEHVAIWAHNVAEWPLVEWGAALAGLVLVGVNPALGEQEGGYIVEHSDAVLLLHVERHRDNEIGAHARTLADRAPKLRKVIELSGVRAAAADAPVVELPSPGPDDPVQIQYTSGTTGRPKGVLLAHRTFVNVPELCLGHGGVPTGGLFVNPLPMFHTAGGGICSYGPVARGTGMLLVEQFAPDHVLDLVERHGATALGAVPTVLIALLQHPSFAGRDFSALQAVLVGGAAVPAAVVRQVQRDTGATVAVLFGMTELGATVCQTRPDDSPDDTAETIGRPLPHAETKLVDPATGDTAPIGTAGEFCARGYQQMIGYYKDDDATARTVDADGWLHTGDLCTLDERGYYRVTGRVKDMIIRGGENIAPVEIEGVLHAHPAVQDAYVVGVPHDKWGEEVCAVVQVAPDASPSADELAAHCAEHLARHKRPVHWYAADGFPLTASGKVQKFRLVEMVAAGDLRPIA
ncbi:MAG: AMP-binding protein [Solirubrobacteraceae bacterium]|nr:AMP-binding protein [Solirubrobacteraceae bacterium]